MRRFTAFILAIAMLAGIGTYPLLSAIACPTGKAMPANCPMRGEVAPAPPVTEVAEAGSCCPKAKMALEAPASRPHSQLTGRCCCDMRARPDAEEAPALLPVEGPVIALLSAPLTAPAPLVVTLPVVSAPVWNVDAPRGPPRTLHAPRAPPFFS